MRFWNALTVAVLASALSGCTVLGLAQLLCAVGILGFFGCQSS
jgi:hypothetical protein